MFFFFLEKYQHKYFARRQNIKLITSGLFIIPLSEEKFTNNKITVCVNTTDLTFVMSLTSSHYKLISISTSYTAVRKRLNHDAWDINKYYETKTNC